MDIEEFTGHYVSLGEQDYIRFSADNWMYRIGESLESEYDCEKLEKEFQEIFLGDWVEPSDKIIGNYDLKMTCYACPEQYDVYRDNKIVGYIRLRHGTLRVHCPDSDGEEVYATSDTEGDGIFATAEERKKEINICVEHIDKWFNDVAQD